MACKRNADSIRSEGARGGRIINGDKREVFGKRGGFCGGRGGLFSGELGGFCGSQGGLGGSQGGLGGGLLGSLEFAVDSDEGVLIETGIGFHAGFGGGTAFEHSEIMAEETNSPFEGSEGVVVLEGMSNFLGSFDEFAVRYAGRRPGFWEMVGVELMELASPAGGTADDDVFVVMPAFLTGVHDTIIHVNAERELQIANSATMGGGDFGVRNIARNNAIQTVFYYGF